MKAIRLHQPGGPEQLRFDDVATPVPGPGEILVQLKAAALGKGSGSPFDLLT
jgi:NADPH2:quinone reductase